jgi:phytoene synthase
MTNIARDVADDAAMGRVYLPADWLAQEGVAPEAVADRANRDAVARVVARLLATAEPYYASARVGLRHLPFRSAWAIAAARGVYRDIGRGVLRRGAGALDRRVSTGKGRKIYRALHGGLQATSARSVERLFSDPPRGDLWTKPEQRD